MKNLNKSVTQSLMSKTPMDVFAWLGPKQWQPQGVQYVNFPQLFSKIKREQSTIDMAPVMAVTSFMTFATCSQ